MGQCEYKTAEGQCNMQALPGRAFCTHHKAPAKASLLGKYRLACSQLGDAPERHADASELKSLRAEIAITRSLIESRLNQINDAADLVSATPAINTLINTVERLAKSCHDMDVKLGNLLGKAALLALAKELIRIIERNIRPLTNATPTQHQIDEILEQVGAQMVEAIAKQENSQ